MNVGSWDKFVRLREHFRCLVKEIDRALPGLREVQQKLVDSKGGGASYTVETPVVYNGALDEITAESEIKLIIVADNPGRREQAAENRRYLAGPSGKIAAKFFRDNPQLGIDFYKNVLILNKTPVHSPRTADLKKLINIEKKKKDCSIAKAIESSQVKMARLLLEFHEAFSTCRAAGAEEKTMLREAPPAVPVFIIGYSEMKKGGIFEAYTNTLNELYKERKNLLKQLFFFRHFSMNQFTADLKKKAMRGETTEESLRRIGSEYREKILKKIAFS